MERLVLLIVLACACLAIMWSVSIILALWALVSVSV